MGIESFQDFSSVGDLVNSNHSNCSQSLVFDETGYFLLYTTLLGIKIYNIELNKISRIIGSGESGDRFLNLTLFQGVANINPNLLRSLLKDKEKASSVPSSISSSTSSSSMTITKNKKDGEGPANDPIVVATSFKKRRFYIFSRRAPDLSHSKIARDKLNEAPKAEDIETFNDIVK